MAMKESALTGMYPPLISNSNTRQNESIYRVGGTLYAVPENFYQEEM